MYIISTNVLYVIRRRQYGISAFALYVIKTEDVITYAFYKAITSNSLKQVDYIPSPSVLDKNSTIPDRECRIFGGAVGTCTRVLTVLDGLSTRVVRF